MRGRSRRRRRSIEPSLIRVMAHYSKRENCSGESPATRMMARSVPRSSCLWSGTTTWAKGSARRRIIWLLSCLFSRNPTFSRALAHVLPEITGSFVTLPRGVFETALQERPGHLPPGPQYSPEWPAGCSGWLLAWFHPGRRTQAGLGTLRSSSHLPRGAARLASCNFILREMACKN